jgi:hypothetical protein
MENKPVCQKIKWTRPNIIDHYNLIRLMPNENKMHIKRNISVLTGILFLIAASASIAALLLYGPVLNNPEYILSGLHNSRTSWGAVLEIITAFAIIGTSVTLYPVLKRYNERMALGAVCFRTAEAIVIIIGILCLMTIVTLNVRFGSEMTADASTYVTVGKLLVAFHNWTFLYGPNVLLGPSTLMTAYLLHRSTLVPRFISILGLIGGPMIFLCGVLVTLGLFDQISPPGTLLALPVFAYEMSLAIWLVVKGFNQISTPAPLNNLYKLASIKSTV